MKEGSRTSGVADHSRELPRRANHGHRSLLPHSRPMYCRQLRRPRLLRIRCTLVCTSQSLTVLSSNPSPDARVWPSGEKATACTGPKCLSSVARSSPVTGSQSLITPSPPPDASNWPSGEKATDKADRRCAQRYFCLSGDQDFELSRNHFLQFSA